MRYTVELSQVQVIGHIWMPNVTAAYCFTLDTYDVENIKDEDGNISREDVQDWLYTHAGDFREITDFRADISAGPLDFVSDWESEESEMTYWDCMDPMPERGEATR